MATANVEIHDEVADGPAGDWRLCFQRVTYHYDDGSDDEDGYRFIWRRPMWKSTMKWQTVPQAIGDFASSA